MTKENLKDLDIEFLKQKTKCRAVVLPEKTKLVVYVCRLLEERTAGGIIIAKDSVITDSYKKTRGLVLDIAHASKEDEENCNVKEGDVVCFRPFEGIVKVGEDETYSFRLLSAHEIHSIETK